MSVIVSLLGTVLGTMLGTAATTRQAEDINCSNAGRVCTPLLTSANCCLLNRLCLWWFVQWSGAHQTEDDIILKIIIHHWSTMILMIKCDDDDDVDDDMRGAVKHWEWSIKWMEGAVPLILEMPSWKQLSEESRRAPLAKTCCKFYPPPCVKPKLWKKFGRRNGQKWGSPPTKKWRESQRSLDDCPPNPPPCSAKTLTFSRMGE